MAARLKSTGATRFNFDVGGKGITKCVRITHTTTTNVISRPYLIAIPDLLFTIYDSRSYWFAATIKTTSLETLPRASAIVLPSVERSKAKI